MLGSRSLNPNLVPLDPEVEQSLSALRAIRARIENLDTTALISMANEEEPKLALKDHFIPNDYCNPSCIIMQASTSHYSINPQTI